MIGIVEVWCVRYKNGIVLLGYGKLVYCFREDEIIVWRYNLYFFGINVCWFNGLFLGYFIKGVG